MVVDRRLSFSTQVEMGRVLRGDVSEEEVVVDWRTMEIKEDQGIGCGFTIL